MALSALPVAASALPPGSPPRSRAVPLAGPTPPPRRFERELVALAPDLRGRARRLARSEALAEDLVQDTVERALRFRAQYREGTSLKAWLHQILFSVFVTRFRRLRREREALRRLGDEPDAWVVPEGVPGPEQALRRMGAGVEQELASLPEGYREVIAHVDLGERSYRETARLLGVPLGTVMSRLHRGRRLLAERLREAA